MCARERVVTGGWRVAARVDDTARWSPRGAPRSAMGRRSDRQTLSSALPICWVRKRGLDRLALRAADCSMQPTIFFQRDSRLMNEVVIRLRSDAIDVKTLTILHQYLGCATTDPRRVRGTDGALLLAIHGHTHHARGLPSCPHAGLHRGRLSRLRVVRTSHRWSFVHLGPVRGDSDAECVSL